MILPIYTYGQPVLRQIAEDIPLDYPNLQKLITDMYETMEKSDGVGLAAPQIGLPIRVVVIGLDSLAEEDPKYKGFLHAYINGHILEESEDTDTMEEGCLSLPGIHESVRRATKVRVKYLDENLQEHDEWVDGFLARVIQHEFDHLEGHMFVDHVGTLRKQMIKGKLKDLLSGKFRCAYKVKIKR